MCTVQTYIVQTPLTPPQEEYDDEDDWNPCKAAGVCLSLMASCCENDIVPRVLPFVDQHLQNTDWKFRDASVMALGTCVVRTYNLTLGAHAQRGLLCVSLCVCLSVCVFVCYRSSSYSVRFSLQPTASTALIEARGFSKNPSVQKLWREKANMQISYSSPRAIFAHFLDQRNTAAS